MTIELYEVWNFIKKHIMRHKIGTVCLLNLAVLCLFAGSIAGREKADLDLAVSETRTMQIPLEKGIYDVTVSYVSSNGGYAQGCIESGDKLSVYSDKVSLDFWKNQKEFQVWINRDSENFYVSYWADEGTLEIDSVRIRTAWNSGLYQMAVFLVKLACVNLLILGYLCRERLQKYSFVICGILGITFVCSVGLFTRYLIMGHDAMFHMNRIEGLKDGLLSGVFPVRIQPTWNNGWGYAVSVMYGDIIILLPALMRICGFTIQAAWKTFVVAINLLTAIVTFYSAYRICKDKYKAMFITFLYCTSIYRLICIYVRAAVGEFAVMAFIPLVVLFFWYAFAEDTEDKDYGKHLLLPVMGFTGMIQTHILTCEISAIFIVLLCVVMIKKVLRKKTFFYLAKTAVLTVLVNLWFLVPFMRFFTEELVVCKMSEMRDDFQVWGLSITELFATSASGAFWFTFGENVSLAHKCTYTIGTALLLCGAVTLYLLWNKKVKFQKAAACMLCFGIIAAFMTTNLFPYQMVREYMPKFAAILSKIQFSYRFLGMASLFFVLAILFTILGVEGEKTNRYLKLFMVGVAFLSIYQGADYQYRILYGGSFDTKYSAAALDSAYLVSGEYLYENASADMTRYDQSIRGIGTEIMAARKEYLTTHVTCKANDKEAYVELPVFYYPGYIAVDENGKDYKVTRSDDNSRIKVELPQGFEGELKVYFKEPLYWRICEVLSMIALVGMIVYENREKQSDRSEEKASADMEREKC